MKGMFGEYTKQLMTIIQGSGPMAFAMGMAKDFIVLGCVTLLGILLLACTFFAHMQ